MHPQSVAVLIPCLNEALTIGSVVRQFRETLPHAQVYVFDNASSDETAVEAQLAGASVIRSHSPGKGNVVRHMLSQVQADTYLIIDGDGTYDVAAAPALIRSVEKGGAGMCIGQRVSHQNPDAMPPLRGFGNKLFSWTLRRQLKMPLHDVLSGYRALTHELAEKLKLTSSGFEIEAELTIRAAKLGYSICEVPTSYYPRPHGSRSKLNAFRDGARILRFIVKSWT